MQQLTSCHTRPRAPCWQPRALQPRHWAPSLLRSRFRQRPKCLVRLSGPCGQSTYQHDSGSHRHFLAQSTGAGASAGGGPTNSASRVQLFAACQAYQDDVRRQWSALLGSVPGRLMPLFHHHQQQMQQLLTASGTGQALQQALLLQAAALLLWCSCLLTPHSAVAASQTWSNTAWLDAPAQQLQLPQPAGRSLGRLQRVPGSPALLSPADEQASNQDLSGQLPLIWRLDYGSADSSSSNSTNGSGSPPESNMFSFKRSSSSLQQGGYALSPSSTSNTHSSSSNRAHTAAVQPGRGAAADILGTSPSDILEIASEMEDNMLQALREVEAKLDSAVGAITSTVQQPLGGTSSQQQDVDDAARALITEVWEVVDANYMDARHTGFDHGAWRQLRDQALAKTYRDKAGVYRAVRDMLARGVRDPYCRFITPQEFASMKKYDVTGVGLNLGTGEEFVKKTGRELPHGAIADDQGVWVVGLSKGSAADVAGIEQGDQLLKGALHQQGGQLLKVDGVTTVGLTPFQVAGLISGPDDSILPTLVELQGRKPDGTRFTVGIERPARVLPSPVKSYIQMRSGGRQVGVVSVASFNARAERDVVAALRRLEQMGATELELDLRDNRGGLVNEGLEVARLFLEGDVPIVLTQSNAMAADPPLARGPPATRLPLVVLVNEHTASASEILAGALKDNCRAVLVGKRTYGKGLIQSVYELSDSSGLVITVGKYLTPNGVDIDRSGITPEFKSPPEPGAAAQAIKACRLTRDPALSSNAAQQLANTAAVAEQGSSL